MHFPVRDTLSLKKFSFEPAVGLGRFPSDKMADRKAKISKYSDSYELVACFQTKGRRLYALVLQEEKYGK